MAHYGIYVHAGGLANVYGHYLEQRGYAMLWDDGDIDMQLKCMNHTWGGELAMRPDFECRLSDFWAD